MYCDLLPTCDLMYSLYDYVVCDVCPSVFMIHSVGDQLGNVQYRQCMVSIT